MLKTFKHAIEGIVWTVRNERNLKIHLIAATAVIGLGLFFSISATHWVILLVCIGIVISAELMNTAIEKTLDLLHPEISYKVKIIKDISAGAVLVLSIIAAVIGVVIFYGYLV